MVFNQVDYPQISQILADENKQSALISEICGWKPALVSHLENPKFRNFQVFPAHDFFTLSENQMAPSLNTPKLFFWTLNLLLGLAFIVEILAPRFSSDFDALTLTLAAVASVAALNRQLPLQNVLPAALITAAVGGLAHGFSANQNFSIPFGPIVFSPAFGAKIFNTIPWPILMLWVVAIFNARGMARLILRPWRKVKNYGFWLIGLTAVLAVAFDVALEPFAWHVKHFWLWQPTRLPITWQGTTLLNFFGWLFVSALILAFATPSLIKKQPGNPSQPDLHPLAVWLGAFVLFTAGAAGAGLWWPVGVDAAIAVVTTVFAVRGAQW